jgi:hypothetical protein
MNDQQVLAQAPGQLDALRAQLVAAASDGNIANDRAALVAFSATLDLWNSSLATYLATTPETPVEAPLPAVDYSRITKFPRPELTDEEYFNWVRLWLYGGALPRGWSWSVAARTAGRTDPGWDKPAAPPSGTAPDMSGTDLDKPGRRENQHAADVAKDYTFTARSTYTSINLGGNFHAVKYRVFGPGYSGALKTDTKSGSIPSWDLSLSGLTVGALYRVQLSVDQATLLSIEKNPK